MVGNVQAESDPLKENRDLFKMAGGAPLTRRFQAVERTIRVVVRATKFRRRIP